VWVKSATAGGLATGALLGVDYALSQLDVAPFFPLDVAQAGIKLTPGFVATQGIDALGPGAKVLAETTALLVVVLAGAAIGALASRWRVERSWSNVLPLAAVALALVVGAQLVASTVPDAISLGVLAVLVVGWGIVLVWLLRHLGPAPEHVEPSADRSRRNFLRRAGSVLLLIAASGGALGEVLRRGQDTALAEAIARGDPVPGVALGSDATITFPVVDPSFAPGIGARPEATAPSALYVVSSEVRSPRVDPASWQLTVSGLVVAALKLTYADLRSMTSIEQPSTLTCISNEVGGGLTGTGVWSGVRLRTLLDAAGVAGEPVAVVLRSITGYADAIPFEKALDEQTLVAYGFGGEALLRDHGFPARLVVPGLYGMKNVKWLSGIELIGQEFTGYWEERGWDPTATVRTQSTVDTGNSALGNPSAVRSDNGLVGLGGYAFAGARGISRVELRIDDGGWQPAQLKTPASDITWRPWRFAWTATTGDHVVSVRAFDGGGTQQPAELSPPHPAGASGWHTLRIHVD
jgi:DMSO/TMAO reductase YedYZ molybdopterin-dependent catalytic subunit